MGPAVSAFQRAFTRPPEVRATAPGRVHLIGEHSDDNQGLALAAPTPHFVQVELAALGGRDVLVTSDGFDRSGGGHAWRLGEESPAHDWTDLVRGLTRALVEEGLGLGGFAAAIESEVPAGSGLSSSTALLVALQRALRQRFGLRLDDLRIAQLARRVEHELTGARAGSVASMVSSLGRAGSALFIDTRDLDHHLVPLPPSIEIVLVDSGTVHGHAGGESDRRREECERAAALLGVGSLRELEGRAGDDLAHLPEPLGRRVRHLLTEHDRVRAAVRALEEDRPERLGLLLDESHRSLRDDYQVSTDAVDLLVERLRSQIGILGARLAGDGCGGAVVAVARAGTGLDAAWRAADEYATDSGQVAHVLLPRGVHASSAAAQERPGA